MDSGGSRALADPTDPDRPTSTDLVAPSRSPSRPSRLESLQVARPSRFERPKSTEKVARAAPRRDFRRFLVDFGVDFRGFSLLTARAFLDSIFESIFVLFRGFLTRASRLASKWPTLAKHCCGRCFVRVRLRVLEPKIDRSSPRERSPNALREHPKIDRKSGENRPKIGLRVNRAKTTRFFCSRTRLGIDFGRRGALPGAPGRPFLAFRGALGDPPGTPGGRRGRSGTLPRHS